MRSRTFSLLVVFASLLACKRPDGALLLLPTATLDQARACRTASGEWRCARLAPPKANVLGVTSSVIPTVWTVASWFIDPANATGCANDQNDCQHSACSGSQGPCVTYGEITARWGTTAPRLRQATTLTVLSSQATDSDPIYFRPQIENAAQVTVAGALNATSQTSTGTITVNTQKNRATPALPNITLSLGGAAVGNLIKITDSGTPKYAWLWKTTGANTFTLSQQINIDTGAGVTPLNPKENDTLTNGDAYVTYAPFSLNLVDVEPVTNAFNQPPTPMLIENLTAFDPNPGSLTNSHNPLTTEGPAVWANVSYTRTVVNTGKGAPSPAQKFTNGYFQSGFALQGPPPVYCSTASPPTFVLSDAVCQGGATEITTAVPVGLYGGVLLDNSSFQSYSIVNGYIDFDLLITATGAKTNLTIGGTTIYGCIDEEANGFITAEDAHVISRVSLASTSACTTNALVWGPGTTATGWLGLNGRSRWAFGAGVATPSANFPNSTTARINMNGQTSSNSLCCHTEAAPDVVNCGFTSILTVNTLASGTCSGPVGFTNGDGLIEAFVMSGATITNGT